MLRSRRILIILLINCMLLELARGLIGFKVRDAESNEYPFVVSISGKAPVNITDHRDFVNLHICTGTLISRKSVITAAHCLLHKQPSNIEIIAGSKNLSKGKKFYPESWTTFAEWKYNQTNRYSLNDIAMIRLQGDGITDHKITPATILMVDSAYLEHKDVRLLGWGITDNGKQPLALKMALLKVMSNEECSSQGSMLKGSHFAVPPHYFCSKTNPWVLSSQGDGGGPLLNKYRQLVGVNVGVCPKVENYPEEMLHELQMNSHLNFQYYQEFIRSTIRY